jgi:hypothetical protein
MRVCKTAQDPGIGRAVKCILGLLYMAFRAMRALVVQGDI